MLESLPWPARQRVVGRHLDTVGRQALAQTCHRLRDEVGTALDPAERHLRNAWVAVYTDEDSFVDHLERLEEKTCPGPLAGCVATLSVQPLVGLERPGAAAAQKSVARRERYERLRRNFHLASELFGGPASWLAPATEANVAKLSALVLVSELPSAWPMPTVRLLARAPCVIHREMEPSEASTSVRAFLANQLERLAWLRQDAERQDPTRDWTMVYPTAVHPSCMEGELMWGVDAREYLFVAISGSLAAPSGSWAPAADTIYTYSWNCGRGDSRWECAMYSRRGNSRLLDGGLVPSFGRLVNDGAEFAEISACLQRGLSGMLAA